MHEIVSVIIDDERANRELIKSMIPRLNPAFVIAGEAEGVESGFSEISRLNPAVVFLDIRMGDGTGFDLLRKFRKISFEVVFVSAFDEYAINAFEFNALDYVLKPVGTDKFRQTLLRVQNRIGNNFSYFDSVTKAAQGYEPNSLIINRIPIHHNGQVTLVDLKDIMYIRAHEGYTELVQSKQVRFVSSKQLSDYHFILDSLPNFMKITKGCYVNVNYISSYSKGLLNSITMKDESVHEISRRKKTEILARLSQS
jgi:two-component system, LytTR family, response regulator